LRKAKDAFFYQRVAARYRGIDWDLTFTQWWNIWRKSGKWEQRGRRSNQYQMARYNDVGPYSVTNVRIISAEENLEERISLKGEDNPYATLTEDDVRKIRFLEGKMKRPEVAKMFGLNYFHVRDIQKRRCWKHVK